MRPIVKLLPASLALAIVASSALVATTHVGFAQNQAPAGDTSDEVKQVPLTDDQIQHFLAAHKDIDTIVNAMPDSANGEPDAATTAKLDAIAKKNGFANLADYQSVSGNIELVMAGIDPQTKKYLGADGMIKQQIAQIQADKSMKPKDKAEMLKQLNEDLKSTVPVKIPANIEIVTKNFDKLSAAVSQE